MQTKKRITGYTTTRAMCFFLFYFETNEILRDQRERRPREVIIHVRESNNIGDLPKLHDTVVEDVLSSLLQKG